MLTLFIYLHYTLNVYTISTKRAIRVLIHWFNMDHQMYTFYYFYSIFIHIILIILLIYYAIRLSVLYVNSIIIIIIKNKNYIPNSVLNYIYNIYNLSNIHCIFIYFIYLLFKCTLFVFICK